MILGAVTLMVPELSSGATEVVSPKTYANPRVFLAFWSFCIVLVHFGIWVLKPGLEDLGCVWCVWCAVDPI